MLNRNLNAELRKLQNLPLIDRLEKINQLQISLYELKRCCRKTLKTVLGGYDLFKTSWDLISNVERTSGSNCDWIFHISTIDGSKIYDRGFYSRSISSQIDQKVYQLGTYRPHANRKLTGLSNQLANSN